MKLRVSTYETGLLQMASPYQITDVCQLPQSSDEWQNWYQLIQLNRIETQVYNYVRKNALSIPMDLNSKIESRANAIRLQNKKRRESALKLFDLFTQNKIDFIVLKGNSISQDVYKDSDYKQMNDFDLLFKRQDLDRVLDVLNSYNMTSAAALSADFRKQEKYSHHWPPFFTKSLDLFIGVHWNLVSPLSEIEIDESSLWENCEEFSYESKNLKRLSPINFVLHMCVHLSPYKLGVKEIADFYNFLIYKKSDFSVADLIEKFKRTNSLEAAYFAFAILDSLFVDTSISQITEKLKDQVPDSLVQSVAFRTAPAQKFVYLRTSQVSKIEKNYGLFTLAECPAEKAYFLFKMWKNYLWADRDECFRLNYQVPNKNIADRVRVSFMAIIRITQSLMKDLGPTVFILVTINHHVELIKALLKKVLGKSCQTLESKARQMGLSISEIKAVSQLD